MHDTASSLERQAPQTLPFFTSLLGQVLPPETAPDAPRKRGRPQQLSWSHLWFALILGLLQGMRSYQDLWRSFSLHPWGAFAPVSLTDDAIIKRLRQAGTAPLEAILTRLSAVLARLLNGIVACDLAPFASEILAIDETTWEAVQRHLPSLRSIPKGDPALLPGKLAARFNIRTQQWDLVQFRSNPLGNCLLEVCSLIQGVPAASLLLFDLGYFTYAWFDYLTQMHLWFVCRIRQNTCYQLAHTFYRHEGILDALVWLGSTGRNTPRTGSLLRLVRFWDGQHLRTYLTNQLDPHILPLPDIARLYARRWDIELAFLTLKEHLGLHHWWSANEVLRQQQALLVLIAAQLLQAIRLLIAHDAGCDPFEVSLPLLVRHLPHILRQRWHPVGWVLAHGRSLGFFRPSSRYLPRVPTIAPAQLRLPPPDLAYTRLACYLSYPDRPNRPPRRSAKARPPS